MIRSLLALFVFLLPPTAIAQTAAAVPQSAEQVRYSYAPLVKTVSPSVVNVYAARQVTERPSPFAGDRMFQRFFGNRGFGQPQQRQRTAKSLGSGVIVGTDGVIVTNFHVVKGMDEIRIALSDGREFDATIQLQDEVSDLAVLKVDAGEPLPVVELGDSEALEVGDLVLALGNPFGIGQTVTSGIVSALARSQNGIEDFGFFVQTDASINPGNSGGALVDMAGRLIGINTAIYSRSGGSNGVGFAVPSNMVRVVLDSVRAGSNVLLRPWIGAGFEPVTPDIALSLGMPRPSGALVSRVEKGGPADEAGLRVGDIVLALDGKIIPQVDAFGYRLATAGIGRTVSVQVISGGEPGEVELSLREPPEEPARQMRTMREGSPFGGMEVANLSPRMAQEIGLTTEKRGVVVVSVPPNTAAARFGFRPKDIIVMVRDTPVDDTKTLDEITRVGGRGWPYVVERNNRLLRQFVR